MIFLGLDIGTSGARAVGVEDGAIVAEATATYPLLDAAARLGRAGPRALVAPPHRTSSAASPPSARARSAASA